MNFTSIFANLLRATDKNREVATLRELAFSFTSAFSSAWSSIFGRRAASSTLSSSSQPASSLTHEERALYESLPAVTPEEERFLESEWERQERIHRIQPTEEESRKRGPTDAIDAFLHYREWLPVESSHVVALWYDPAQKYMEIEYHDGSVYGYSNVGADLAELFANASSKGTLVWDHFRRRGTQFGYNPAHPYVLVQPATKREIKWFQTQESRLRHGRIGPEGY